MIRLPLLLAVLLGASAVHGQLVASGTGVHRTETIRWSDGSSPDFTGTYSVNHLAGIVTYSESGALVEGLACEGEWGLTFTVWWRSFEPAHTYSVSIDLDAGMYIIEESRDGYSVRTWRECSTGAQRVALLSPSECAQSALWEPNAVVDEPLPLAPGWTPFEGSGPEIALGAAYEKTVPVDLAAHRMRLAYQHGSGAMEVPFTGRVYFQDPATGNDLYHRTFLAGWCLPAIPLYGDGTASPGSCCLYQPSRHDVLFGATNTHFGARPFGMWRADVHLCNAECS